MDKHLALTTATVAGQPWLRQAYAAAVARGFRNTRCTAEQERAYGALRLLTLALLRLPDLALCAYVLDAGVDAPEGARVPSAVVCDVCDVAAGALRLTHRALEVHGREVGCETGAWVDRAIWRAAGELACHAAGTSVSAGLDHSRLAALALTRATAATACDRMCVPAELAGGLAHLLAVYVIGIAGSG
jgi:hypothetical protein